ncbi:hypothetical protein A3219_21425 [Salmonella enterica]|nr:hypothetical protein A3219_21425 [Salmonella enterica]
MGSAQRLANGNTFICESAFGRLFEVTPEGETVWEYIIPFFNEYPEHRRPKRLPGSIAISSRRRFLAVYGERAAAGERQHLYL